MQAATRYRTLGGSADVHPFLGFVIVSSIRFVSAGWDSPGYMKLGEKWTVAADIYRPLGRRFSRAPIPEFRDGFQASVSRVRLASFLACDRRFRAGSAILFAIESFGFRCYSPAPPSSEARRPSFRLGSTPARVGCVIVLMRCEFRLRIRFSSILMRCGRRRLLVHRLGCLICFHRRRSRSASPGLRRRPRSLRK